MYAANLNVAGLYTFPNDLTSVPPGALLTADNFIINRPNTAESRRGFAAIGTSLGLASGQWVNNEFPYQNRLILSDTTNQLWYDSTGSFNWVKYTGTFAPPTGAYKIHGGEANKNFYLSTNTGVYKLDSISSTPVLAGGVPALDGTAVLTGVSGFLLASTQCVYQVVWGYSDANGNLILGNPSERILVSNTTGSSANVNVTFTVPQGVTTSYFYQLYRTPATTYSATPSSNVPPGAELQLATQQAVTSGNISAGTITYTDVTPDSLLGAFLYTNPSQQGPDQTNDRPPFCVDFCTFSGMTFYANVQTLNSCTFNLISVGSPSGIQIGDTVTVNGAVFTGAASQNNAAKQFKVDTSGTVAQNIDTTARNFVACLDANVATTNINAFYTSGYNDLPGMIELQAASFVQGVFYVTSSRGGAFSPVLPSSGTTFASSNDNLPNGVYVSKLNQPEAVPLVNLEFVGGGDQPIYRVLPLRDRVVVLKSDGVFTITGSTPDTLTITPLDTTVILISPESARLLNNSVYCLTNQGVASVNESGVTIKSRAIELDILQVTAPQFTNFGSATHAISYESERLYILCTVSATTNTFATQAYCYNWITDAWTRWPLDISSGLVNPLDNKLYLGRPSNQSFLYQERKAYTLQDYVDDIFPVTISSATGKVVSVNTVSASWIGYQLLQGSSASFITAVNTMANTLTVTDTLTWTAGAASVLEPIPLSLQWCPVTAGFPHFMKNWTRCNFWFANGQFNTLSASFVSDLSSYSESVGLTLGSNGPWGLFSWGNAPWGGNSNFAQSVQTLVPRQKSLAHWVQPALTSGTPYTKIAIDGVTLTYDIVSDVMR